MKNKIIEKYIKRIKIDYPEDDKIYGDLMGFATEIELILKAQVEQKPEVKTDLREELIKFAIEWNKKLAVNIYVNDIDNYLTDKQ